MAISKGDRQRVIQLVEQLPDESLSEVLDFVSRVENEDAERAAAILQLAQNQVEVDDWQYLAKRNHPWRKQLYVKGQNVKGQKLLASTIWQDMIANKMSVEEAADNWDLPLDAIDEVVRYCESYRDLLLEAEKEAYKLSCTNEILCLE